jgi:hypothetical protein
VPYRLRTWARSSTDTPFYRLAGRFTMAMLGVAA